jgi:hypothetical protein
MMGQTLVCLRAFVLKPSCSPARGVPHKEQSLVPSRPDRRELCNCIAVALGSAALFMK